MAVRLSVRLSVDISLSGAFLLQFCTYCSEIHTLSSLELLNFTELLLSREIILQYCMYWTQSYTQCYWQFSVLHVQFSLPYCHGLLNYLPLNLYILLNHCYPEHYSYIFASTAQKFTHNVCVRYNKLCPLHLVNLTELL